MRISFEPDPPHYPLCWDCQEPIIPDEEYFRIKTDKGVHFHHKECFITYHIQYMTEGGAE